ncbi:MAG: hypothetical protein LBG15_05585 [Dysgonamonadaceae bacterium]|jgi:hypothetical protein|nr:hypothetical protein [Dysgonamonadaceae bacterium]
MQNNNIQLSDHTNLLAGKDVVSLDEYLATYKSRITQESERLFVRDFVYPLFDDITKKHVRKNQNKNNYHVYKKCFNQR